MPEVRIQEHSQDSHGRTLASLRYMDDAGVVVPSDDVLDITDDAKLVLGGRFVELTELSADPAAPAANVARLYTKDNGSGKTLLCVRFSSGAVQTVATQP